MKTVELWWATWAPYAVQMLWTQTVCFNLAVLAVALLRRPLLRLFGAPAAAHVWLLVPLTLLTTLLPQTAALPGLVLQPVLAMAGMTKLPLGAATTGLHSVAVPSTVLLVWALGAATLSFVLMFRQRAFERALTRTAAPLPWRSAAGCSPAVCGLWRPRLVLPMDFERRFDSQEQHLIKLHEAEHQRRFDNAWNLLAAVLLALYWFNPLAWWAQRRWRADQELACDAAVLAQQPSALAAYARAMLKSQGLTAVSSLASSWLSVHPLIERTTMLKQHVVLFSRRTVGRRLAWAVALFGAGMAYAAQGDVPVAISGPAQQVEVEMTWRVADLVVAKPRMVFELGSSASMTYRPAPGSADPTAWQVKLQTTAMPDGRLRVVSDISSSSTSSGNEPLRSLGGSQVLITEPGRAFGLKVSGATGGPELHVEGVARLLDAAER